MADYTDDIATAKELIDEFGQDCWWQPPAASDGPSEPGYPGEDGELPDPIKCKIAWFNEHDLSRGTYKSLEFLIGTEVPTGALVGLLAGGQTFVPKLTDTVRRGAVDAVPITINNIDELAPDGTPILYSVFVTR